MAVLQCNVWYVRFLDIHWSVLFSLKQYVDRQWFFVYIWFTIIVFILRCHWLSLIHCLILTLKLLPLSPFFLLWTDDAYWISLSALPLFLLRDTMLMQYTIWHRVYLSIRLLQAGVLLRQLSVFVCKQRHTIAHEIYIPDDRDLGKIPVGHPQLGRQIHVLCAMSWCPSACHKPGVPSKEPTRLSVLLIPKDSLLEQVRWLIMVKQSWQFCKSNMINVQPARVVQWLDHLGAMCSRAWRSQCAIGPEFNPSRDPVRRFRLRKKQLSENNSYAHDDQGDNPGQATGGSMVSCIKCDRCWHLD